MDTRNATKGSFFVTGGAVRPDAPSYVERKCDQDLLESLRHGQFCYVLTSRQMGKSSLVVHTAKKLREEDVAVVVWDLTAIGQNLTPEQWYDGLCVRMGDQLEREDALEEFWKTHLDLGPCQRLFAAIREVVLPEVRHLVVFVDEIDMVRSLPFTTDEFFAAVRECYNRRVVDPVLEKVTFCLLGVATPSDLIQDTRMTPFNIGQRIELNDFTEEETAPLARGLESVSKDPKDAVLLLKRILYWTSGHPYLTQRLCRAVVEEGGATRLDSMQRIDPCCDNLFFSHRARERDDNLIFVRERLLRSETDRVGLLHLYEDVLRDRHVPDEETNPLVSLLRLSGIVHQVDGRLKPRNRIYKQTFNRRWIRAHLPDAVLQSQREAYYRGVFRAAAIAAVIVAVLAVMVVITFKKSQEARRSSGLALVSQAKATLVSTMQGQRFTALNAIENAVPLYSDKPSLRDLVVRALALPDVHPPEVWSGVPKETTCAAINSDFSLYALGNQEGRVSVFGKTHEEAINVLPGSGPPVIGLVFSPNSSFLAVLRRRDQTNQLNVWNWREKRSVLRVSDPVNETGITFSPGSDRIAVGMSDGSIVVHPLGENDSPLMTLTTRPARPADQLSFHPFEPLLAACSDNSLNLRVWDLRNGQLTNSFFYQVPVHSLAWHPHGKVLAAGCQDGDICLWYYSSPSAPWKVLRGFKSEVTSLTYNHSGHLLASLSEDKTLSLWVPEVERKMTYYLQNEEVQALAFKDDDKCLGLWQTDTELQCLEIAPAHLYHTLADPAGDAREFEDVDLSPDNKILATATDQGIILWDERTGRKLDLISSATIRSVCFDPGSGQLFASDSEGVWRWNVSPIDGPQGMMLPSDLEKNFQAELSLGESVVNLGRMVVAGDGTLAAVIQQKNILLFDPSGIGETITLESDSLHQTLALSPRGEILATRASDTQDIHLWDTKKRARIQTEIPLQGGPELSFSPDSRWFCASTPDGYVGWNLRDWSLAFYLPFQRPAIQPGLIAFSTKTGLMAVTLGPSTIAVVHLPEGEILVRLESPDRRPLAALAFSHDGRTLVTAAREQVAIVWDLAEVVAELVNLKLGGDLPLLMGAGEPDDSSAKKTIIKTSAAIVP